MSTPVFEGSCVALITPFRNGHVDWDKFRELIDWHIEKGTDALLIAGTTGETSTLTDSEHLELLRTAGMYIDRRVPFIAGTGSNDTAYSIMLSQYAEKHGAGAVLIINPYYNKSTQKRSRNLSIFRSSSITFRAVPARILQSIPLSSSLRSRTYPESRKPAAISRRSRKLSVWPATTSPSTAETTTRRCPSWRWAEGA